jgi:hypothetical protein
MTTPHKCTASLEEHIQATFAVLLEGEVGGGCITQYHALMEIAEACRLINGYDRYVTVLAEDIAAEAEMAKGMSGVVH